jgi:hypothetical protein
LLRFNRNRQSGLHAGGVGRLEVAIQADDNMKPIRTWGGNPVLILSPTEGVCEWKFAASSDQTVEVVQLAFEPR